jgi:hypothetical protein
MWPSSKPARRVRLVARLRPLILLAPVVYGTATAATRFTAPASPTGVDTERGVVVIRCKAEHRYIHSRGAILDVGLDAPAGEIILATGHGLPRTTEEIRRGCSIHGEQRRSYAIANAWRGAVAGTKEHDWAVLLSERRLGADARRLRYAYFEPEVWSQLSAQQAPVQLLLRRVEAEKDTCRLGRTWLSSHQLAAGLFTHSCRSWEGHSGSPIVIGLDGELVVIGIQLGRIHKPLSGDGPPLLGLGRRIDAAIEAALTEAVRLLDRER